MRVVAAATGRFIPVVSLQSPVASPRHPDFGLRSHLEKRICSSFATDGGFGPVTWEHADVVGQVEHAITHRNHQMVEVAAGEVGTTDRAGEELIAGEQNPFAGYVEAAVPWGVPWGVPHLDLESRDRERLPVAQWLRDTGRWILAGRNHSEQRTKLPDRVECEEVIVRVNVGHRPSAPHRFGSAHMIDVTVRQEQGDRDQGMGIEEPCDTRWIRWGIDDDRL